MPVAKLRTSSALDAMKPLANNAVDTYIRQAMGNEPLFSFSRTGDSPVQWIQLLHALDQQDLPGWPFLSPLKVQMQKCDKCSREFCSPINYRRHIRVHRRSLCVDKESHKNRDLLGAFWDKLSLDKVKQIVSFDDVTLEDVPGSSVVWALTSFIRKPGFCALPQLYVKAGSALLDIIQTRPSRLPISSQELFALLDDASEGTFLCAGMAESMQKYVFDGEAGKIGLEMKNLVACTSFLIEQKLVKVWVADMDAEALRCQKLLVEEEEAAQKRQAKLLERKRQKKLRQKEQKVKEQAYEDKADLEKAAADALDSPLSAETPHPSVSSESSSNSIEAPMDHPLSPESVESSSIQNDTNGEAHNEFSSEHSDSGAYGSEHQRAYGSERRHLIISRWQVPKTHRGGRNGFHTGQDPQASKVESMQRHGPPRDLRTAQVVNSNKVWTRKPKSEDDNGENFNPKLRKAAVKHTDQNCEVMIGSISVTLGKGDSHQQSGILTEVRESCSLEHANSKTSGQDKHTKTDGRVSRSRVKLWRPVSRHGSRGLMPVQGGSEESTEEVLREDNDRAFHRESCQRPSDSDGDVNESWNDSHGLVEGIVQPEGFSSHAAKAFLLQRWKQAIAADHVKLVLTTESEPPDSWDGENEYQVIRTPSDSHIRTVLGNAENLLANVVVLEPSTTGAVKAKFKSNPEKGVKIKYIPKQKPVV